MGCTWYGFLELFAYQFPAGAVLVHAPDGECGFAPELAASIVLHLRFTAIDGHHLALSACLALVQVFPDLTGLHLDSFLRDVVSGGCHERYPLHLLWIQRLRGGALPDRQLSFL
uniref:Uncharacterized protein n=1 Tax=Pseudomonas fluorescens (strain SBW25) TaxID=216595 RepID=A4V7K1_PSEFS|nr:hypothetical protein pQBR0066 [Pseudomonas fluorescens SBW25]